MRTAAVVASALLACTLVAGHAHAGIPDPEPRADLPAPPPPLGHKDLAAAQQALPATALGGLDAADWRAVEAFAAPDAGPSVRRTVLGYLPYWSYSAASPYHPARWDLLTILAWFAAEMNASGDITDKHGWGGATTAAIVQEAHDHGVKVIVTVTNFSASSIATIVGSAATRQNAIDSCLALMAEHQADGINIDFEFVPKAAKADFVTFMSELTDAVRAAQPNGTNGHVSLAGPSNDWSGAYDYDQLLIHTDGIMIMAYGYHWGGGDPGPAATLFSGELWPSNLSIEWTLDDYFTFGGIENRGHVILGLPWYGHAWRVASEAVPGDALADGSTVTYKQSVGEFASNGREWEPVSKSSYYHRGSGDTLQQVWVDDGEAFAARIAYADEMDIGGIGIWALGYEGSGSAMWDAIDAELGQPVTPADPGPEAVEASPEPTPEEVVEEIVEPGPEPTPEPVADTDPGEPPVEERPGSPSATALDPLRNVQSHSVERGGGCGGATAPQADFTGIAGGLAVAALALVEASKRRRARRS